MSNTTGVVFLVVAAAGGIYLYNISSQLSPTVLKEKRKPSTIYARAENASESQINAANVREAASPSLEGGIKDSGRMIERVISTRLAESWRDSELPGLNFKQ